MPRIIIKLNKASLNKISDFVDSIETLNTKELDKFSEQFTSYIISEYKTLREYSESVIIDKYIKAAGEVISQITDRNWSDDYFDLISTKARYEIANYYTSGKEYDNIIDIYFNEVKKEYILHPMNESDSLEFIPENRDIFIKNNLKLVVNCAKRYRYLGVPFEDLIQAGNLGLLHAFDKFDTSRAKVRSEIIDIINQSDKISFTKKEAQEILLSKLTYGKNINIIYNNVPEEGFHSKSAFINWTQKNIKTAVFASVAFICIKGDILSAIAKGTQVRIPYNKLADGYTNFLSIDQMNPSSDDSNADALISSKSLDDFMVDEANIEQEEEEQKFKDVIHNLFSCLDETERRIIKKRFGIDQPNALSYQEIGKQEGISSVKVRNIVDTSLKKMLENISETERLQLEDVLF